MHEDDETTDEHQRGGALQHHHHGHDSSAITRPLARPVEPLCRVCGDVRMVEYTSVKPHEVGPCYGCGVWAKREKGDGYFGNPFVTTEEAYKEWRARAQSRRASHEPPLTEKNLTGSFKVLREKLAAMHPRASEAVILIWLEGQTVGAAWHGHGPEGGR